jgi:hypothetical protein
MSINGSKLAPNPLVSGPIGSKLDPSANRTSGAGSALVSTPKRTSRTVRVEINSLDRNTTKDPSPTQFRWTFPFPVKEVREVRLIGGTVPIPFLNIDSGWNKFSFKEGSIIYTITIPIGFYTITTLLNALQIQLTGIAATNIYTIAQDTASGQVKLTATGGAQFTLLFATGSYTDTMDSSTRSILEYKSPAHILGFGYADYTSSSGSITAPNLPNLWCFLERTYLYLNFDSSQDLRSIFRGSGRKEPSAILYNDELNIYNYPGGLSSRTPIPLTKFLNKETYDTIIVPSPAPLSRISVLEVSLRDMFYNLINTQGREVSLLLELVIVD